MPQPFQTTVVKSYAHNHARVMKMSTPHGEVITPAFMPVGTRAVLNHLLPNDLTALNAQIILGGNTYHMLCSPGMEVVQALGGMHRMMSWNRAMLTDSGGYQVLSLSKNKKLCVLDDNGAHFKHPNSGKIIHMTPAVSIATQKIIGADIIMAFDQCTPEEGGREAAIVAMQRTHRWLQESVEAHMQQPNSAYGLPQALFGIIQGGSYRDLREESARLVLSLPFDGIAIGGEVIGFDMLKTVEILGWLKPLLPENKVCYTMGVGLGPQDLFDVVAAGADIFDCVAPTRNARHGSLYCGEIVEENNWLRFQSTEDRGRLLIKKSIYALDDRPIMETCICYTCQNFSRGYMHFLFKSDAAAYAQLACIHNVSVMEQACAAMRQLIGLS